MFKYIQKKTFLFSLNKQIQQTEKFQNLLNTPIIKNFISSNSNSRNQNNFLNLFTKKPYTYKITKNEKNPKNKKATGEKKPSLYVGDKVEILPEVGDLNKLSHYEKRMLKHKEIKDTELKVGTILKIQRKKNIALVSNHKTEKKYVDINYLGYYFENNRLKDITLKNKNVPISVDRLRLFSEITKDKNNKITSIKPAKIKYRNDPKNRVDMNNNKVFPVFLPTSREIEALRKKKHEEKKVTELDTEYDIAVKTTYKGENFEKITRNFVGKIFNKNYIEKNLILNDK